MVKLELGGTVREPSMTTKGGLLNVVSAADAHLPHRDIHKLS